MCRTKTATSPARRCPSDRPVARRARAQNKRHAPVEIPAHLDLSQPFTARSGMEHEALEAERLAPIGGMTLEQKRELLQSTDPRVRLRVAETTPELHAELQDDFDLYVLTAAGMPADEAGERYLLGIDLRQAEDPNTASWQLEKLADHDHDFVVDALVENPNTPTVALEKLAAGTPVAALHAARRADCSAAALTQFAKSSFPRVRQAAAGNPATPAAALRSLAKDDDRDVLESLAANPATPNSALKTLSNGSGSVAATAAHRRLRDQAEAA